jgi:hypothetical protein
MTEFDAPMSRGDDPDESREHDASVPKESRSMAILFRLKVGGRAAYTTLCDFGQVGGPAANRTLLTNLERLGYVQKSGRIGRAAAFVLTDKGKRVVV